MNLLNRYEKMNKLKEKRFDIAIETRNFEIELFWKRALFFWGFIASAFIAFSALHKFNSGLIIFVSSFGLICSISWALVNRGSKRWQENWERLVVKYGEEIDVKLFEEREGVSLSSKGWLDARKYSVSRLTIALSDYTSFIWFVLFLYSICQELGWKGLYVYKDCFVVGFAMFTFVFIFWLAASAKSKD